jgi:hypothetical protein
MIIVASHINYKQAWETLRSSFLDAGVPLSEVIVVIAGAERLECQDNVPDHEIYITVPYNFYEYTAVYGVHMFMDRPRVKDTCYLLVHDTSVALSDFYNAYKLQKEMVERDNLQLLYLTPSKQLNQVILSYEFIKTYGSHYGFTAGKDLGWKYEHGHQGSFISFADPTRVRAIGVPVSYGPGIKYQNSDIVRHPVIIEPIKLVKYVANNDAHINPPWQERVRP